MNAFALIGPLGLPEILLILAVLALLFGARKLPELGRGLGEGIKNFRGAMKEIGRDDDESPRSKSEEPAREAGSDEPPQAPRS